MKVEIRPLRAEDPCEEFSSGDSSLDRFFHKFAKLNQFRLHIGTTYVAVESSRLVGFVTLAATSITIDELPKTSRKRLPKYPLPALRLARLAVARSHQQRGVGKQLLKAAFAIAHEMGERTGCTGVIVDAKPSAISFYAQFGFEPLELVAGHLGDRPKPVPMFLPLGSIPKAD